MKLLKYDIENAVSYAHKWAYYRNPLYYNYDFIGGDCTNFISQCIFAGGGVMNYEKTFGWYYSNGNDKSPSWTGVEYLWNFLTRSKNSVGPKGEECDLKDLRKGDIIQLSFNGYNFQHSLIVVEEKASNNMNDILVATHTFDTDNRSLNYYTFNKARFIHINGILSD